MNLDVEALLDSTAATPVDGKSTPDRNDRRARDTSRDRDSKRRDRSRSRDRKHDRDGDTDMKSPVGGSDKGSHSSKSRRRSRSPDRDRGASRRERRRDSPERGGDYYRGGGRPRTRSVSPTGSRYYRPSASNFRSRRPEEDRERDTRDRRDDRGSYRDDRGGRGGREGRERDREARRGTPGDRKTRKDKSKTPPLNDDERDRRTVFVQQLAARLRTADLAKFFSKAGEVKEAQIVKDRVSGRSKG
jgi:RNA-binding protein 39